MDILGRRFGFDRSENQQYRISRSVELFGWRRCGNTDIFLTLLQFDGSHHVIRDSLDCDRNQRNWLAYHGRLNKHE